MMKRWFMTALCAVTYTLTLFSQAVVESHISSMEMLVGEQVVLDVSVTANANSVVEFPKTAQMPVGVEVLEAIRYPDEPLTDGKARYSSSYRLTSFDDTLYYLPPLVIKVDGKDYKTNQLALKVLTVEVDTLHPEKFFPAKPVQDNPFEWAEWSMLFWLSVIMLVLFALTYYLYLRLRDNKPIIARIRIVKRLLPHQKAMKAIEEIKADKMASAENPKEYYTKLTDALRRYIEERYGFSAMEMTSTEIISRLMQTDDKTMLDELRQLFMTADLVKFAKYSTLINENDANLVNAIDFINQTKIEDMPTEEVVKPELSAEEKQSQKSRKFLQIFIAVLCVICASMFGYIIFGISQLIF